LRGVLFLDMASKKVAKAGSSKFLSLDRLASPRP
jgi:hypothetical protein